MWCRRLCFCVSVAFLVGCPRHKEESGLVQLADCGEAKCIDAGRELVFELPELQSVPDCRPQERADGRCDPGCGNCSSGLQCIDGVCSDACENLGPLGCCAGNVAYMCWGGDLHQSDCSQPSTPFGSPTGTARGLGFRVECRTTAIGSGCGVNEAGVDTNFCPWCLPDCAGKNCGPDLCGGTCGTCGPGEKCLDGTCIPETCCEGLEGQKCGWDEACSIHCGGCPGCSACGENGECLGLCACDCVSPGCHDDGCGGLCGLCPPGMWCDWDWGDWAWDGAHCVPPDQEDGS